MKNESVKKSLEKSKNVLEEKRKIVKRTICIVYNKYTFTFACLEKTHVYNKNYELRSRAIKNQNADRCKLKSLDGNLAQNERYSTEKRENYQERLLEILHKTEYTDN